MGAHLKRALTARLSDQAWARLDALTAHYGGVIVDTIEAALEALEASHQRRNGLTDRELVELVADRLGVGAPGVTPAPPTRRPKKG